MIGYPFRIYGHANQLVSGNRHLKAGTLAARACARIAAVMTIFCSVGCEQRMARQPFYEPYETSDFFRDGLASRAPVPGTIARGQLSSTQRSTASDSPPDERTEFNRDTKSSSRPKGSEKAMAGIPLAITRELLVRGRDRYAIFCMPCHDSLGTGRGKIVQRGYTRPPSYHETRLRELPATHFYDVITHGYGAMPDYSTEVSPDDRWAIIAYIRALQLSQHTRVEQLSDDEREQLP